MRRSFWGRGARQWGDDTTGRSRDRRGTDAPVRGPYSHPEDRPDCPRCGAHGTRINKAGRRKGLQLWLCFDCQKRFLSTEDVKQQTKDNGCPRCGSSRIEQEHDGTWVCWDCDWFQ